MVAVAGIPNAVNRPGWYVVNPELAPPAETKLGVVSPSGQQGPVKTGRYIVTIADGKGNTQAVYVRGDTVEGPTGKVDWTIDEGPGNLPPAGAAVKTPEEQAADLAQTQAQTQASQATAAQTGEATKTLQQQNAQRDANQSKGLGWLTDAEVTKTGQDAAQLGLTAEGLQIRRAELGQQARSQAVNSQIAARNTDIAAANQALNERKTQLDELYRTNQITLDQAKLQYQEAKDTADREIAASRLDLDRLTQQQSNQVAASNVDINRQTLEQRKAEAEQTQATNALQAQTAAQTAATGQQNAATTAASTILQNQAQGGTAGASLLNQRVAAAQGMLGQVLGLANSGQSSGNMGGGLMNAPAGLGEALVGGIRNWTAELGGGQGVYDAAARMVTAADPQNGRSPEAQAAYGVLTQMLERYQQQTGQPHPAVIASDAANQSQQANGMVAPQIPAPAGQMLPWNNGQPSAVGAPMIAGATPFMNAGTRYYGNGGLQPDQGVWTAPVTVAL